MTVLYLIRHGQTDWNLQGRYTGQSDIPLNATGEQQARAAAAQLAGVKLDAIVASDLQRARRTAEIIAARMGLPVQTDPRLREIHQGVWEGMHFAEIKTHYEEAFQRRKRNPLGVAPPGGETVGQVQKRVLAALRDICAQYPHQQVAVVSHGLALAIIKASLSGHPIQRVWELIPPNAQVERLPMGCEDRPRPGGV